MGYKLALLLCLFLCFDFASQAQHADTIKPASAAIIKPDSVIFDKPEVKASVDKVLWRRHLERQLVPVIIEAVKAGAPSERYTVKVRFVVEKDGSISNVFTMNDPGYGFAQGALDVVRTGPKWSPAQQNGQMVRSYHTQPVTFFIAPTRN